jgi:hypothetical protein
MFLIPRRMRSIRLEGSPTYIVVHPHFAPMLRDAASPLLSMRVYEENLTNVPHSE